MRPTARLTAVIAAIVAAITTTIAPGHAAADPPGVCQTQTITATSATPSFALPVGMGVDSAGNIHVVDRSTRTVHRFDPRGRQTLAIERTDAVPSFLAPNDVAVDPAGNIHVVDSGTDTVYRFDPRGVQTLAMPATNATPQIQDAFDIAVDPTGNIYVADNFTDTVHRFDRAGRQTLAFERPWVDGLAADPAGNIYTSSSSTGSVSRFDATGVETLVIPPGAATPELIRPSSLGVDASGNIVVADVGTAVVYRFDATGTQTSVLPADAFTPDLREPEGVALDEAGNVYVTDRRIDTIFKMGAPPVVFDVDNVAEYRGALACTAVEADASLRISLDADLRLTGSEPTSFAYEGSADLVIAGNGHRIGANGQQALTVTDPRAAVRVDRITMLDGVGLSGGAINAAGAVTVTNSTFADNTAGDLGGAIAAAGPVVVGNSTFTDNRAETAGGAISSTGPVTVAHSTVTTNLAPTGANLVAGGAGVTGFASVIADPRGGGANCDVPSGGGDFNWSDDRSCGLTGDNDVQDVGGDPRLGPLRDNSAGVPPTQLTRFPLSGSPLVDAVPGASCATAPELDFDQRHITRPFGAGCDIGAIEAVFQPHGFSDVTPFYEATVRWITSDANTPQILSGYTDGTFGRARPITRGQVARLYYNAAGAPDVSGLPLATFTDVSQFFEDAIRWAAATGLFDGYPDRTFREADPINRGNHIRSLYHFAGRPDATTLPPHGLTDVTPFYDDAVTWARANGLADGFPDGTYRQDDDVNRGNAARITHNLARTPEAWTDPDAAPPNMLFRPSRP